MDKTIQKIPSEANAKVELLGTETVNGFRCQKKRIGSASRYFGPASESIPNVEAQLESRPVVRPTVGGSDGGPH